MELGTAKKLEKKLVITRKQDDIPVTLGPAAVGRHFSGSRSQISDALLESHFSVKEFLFSILQNVFCEKGKNHRRVSRYLEGVREQIGWNLHVRIGWIGGVEKLYWKTYSCVNQYRYNL